MKQTGLFPGQFIQADKKTKEVEIHFLHISATCKSWFIWPELSNDGNEDKTWVECSRTCSLKKASSVTFQKQQKIDFSV